MLNLQRSSHEYGGRSIFSRSISTNVIEDFKNGKGYNWDYFDYAFKPGIQQDYSLSVRGGSERARYYVMANYYKQDGNYKHTDMADYSTQAVFQRYNFRANVDVDITKNFMLRSTWVHALPTVMPQVQPLAG